MTSGYSTQVISSSSEEGDFFISPAPTPAVTPMVPIAPVPNPMAPMAPVPIPMARKRRLRLSLESGLSSD